MFLKLILAIKTPSIALRIRKYVNDRNRTLNIISFLNLLLVIRILLDWVISSQYSSVLFFLNLVVSGQFWSDIVFLVIFD